LANEILSVDLPGATLHHMTARAVIDISDDPQIRIEASRRSASILESVDWSPSTDVAVLEAISEADRTIPARPAVSWQASPVGGLGDYLMAQFSWTPLDEVRTSWFVYMPPSHGGTLQVPELPSSVQVHAPEATDHVNVNWLSLTDDLFVNGYDDFVTHPFVQPTNFNQSSIR
jgi:hypothetical protein